MATQTQRSPAFESVLGNKEKSRGDAVPIPVPALVAPHGRTVWMHIVPYAIGVFFALWALRGVSCASPVLSDAARHAMNGVLIHDYLVSGKPGNPITFAKEYYSRLPAVSIPYHPPVFPCIEAVFYLIFGVNLLAARLAVALAVVACAVLLFRLAEASHGSFTLAALTTVAFLCLTSTRLLSSDVMLEMPALTFTLGALHCLRELPNRYSLARGLMFALLAEAAVWTKQHTVFLGLVPFLCIALTRSWRLLAEKTIWVSSALFGAALIPLASMPFRPSYGTLYSPLPESVERYYEIVIHHVTIYRAVLCEEFGFIACSFIFVSAVVLLTRQWRPGAQMADALYLAWVVAAALFLTFIAGYDGRYPFFAYPALVFIGFLSMVRLCNLLVATRWVWLAPAVMTLLMLIRPLQSTPSTLFGPVQAAEYILEHSAQRILYCGRSDGSFIFAARALSSSPQLTVFRGDKLPADTFAAEALVAFVRRNQIEYVVFENTAIPDPMFPQPWLTLDDRPPPSLVLERELSVLCYPYRLANGQLRIYRVAEPLPIASLPQQSPRLTTAGEQITALPIGAGPSLH